MEQLRRLELSPESNIVFNVFFLYSKTSHKGMISVSKAFSSVNFKDFNDNKKCLKITILRVTGEHPTTLRTFLCQKLLVLERSQFSYFESKSFLSGSHVSWPGIRYTSIY